MFLGTISGERHSFDIVTADFSDLVLDRISYLAFSFLVLNVDKALGVLHDLQYTLIEPDKPCIASFSLILYEAIEHHSHAPTVKWV